MSPRSPKLAATRYYVDADILGLAKVLTAVRTDVTYPGFGGGPLHKRHRPACPVISTDTLDTVWIPITAQYNWLIVTRDRHIQDHRAEIEAVRSSKARMVALAGEDAKDTWAQLEVLMIHWRKVELLLERPGPFIVSASRTSFREIPL